MAASGYFPLPRVQGVYSRQAHVDLPDAGFERELGREGFYGPASQMIHKHKPTDWSRIDGPLKPRAFDLRKFHEKESFPWDAHPVLKNEYLQIRFWQCSKSMTQLARNADGDELMFFHQGSAELFCDYGHLSIREGDYLVLPRGTQWRLQIHEKVLALMVEASNESYCLPDKGLVGQHAIFDPAMLDIPEIDEEFLAQQSEQFWTVQVKKHNQISQIIYPFNPLDAIGWHGVLTPVRINWRDIRPLMSARYHLPPSAHTTFQSRHFVVCSFVPRPLETDAGALKVPFFHSNDDYDEVIFYHRGDFFSRDNIHPGMLTLHPAGIPHGPHPKAFDTGVKQARATTDEVAVMIDARHALEVAELPQNIEFKVYADSWKTVPK